MQDFSVEGGTAVRSGKSIPYPIKVRYRMGGADQTNNIR